MFLIDIWEKPKNWQEWLYQREKINGLTPMIKNYNDKHYKMYVLKRVIDYDKRVIGERGKNKEKLSCNLFRAKARITELSLCNDWQYFVTLTLDPKKYDRYNLKKYIKDLSQFIRDQRKKYGAEIKYLLVPEMHENGAWHMHGLLMGLNDDMLSPNGNCDKHGNLYFHWTGYAKKFGYMSLSPVRDSVAVGLYMRKYITKTLADTVLEVGNHTYYSSRGLKNAGDSIELDYRVIYDDDLWRMALRTEYVDFYNVTPDEGKKFIEKYSVVGDENILLGGN